MSMPAVRTCTGYGYRLGGPGAWNLHGVPAGGVLHAAWYDETDPAQTFAASAMAALTARLGFPVSRACRAGAAFHVPGGARAFAAGLEPGIQCPAAAREPAVRGCDLLLPDRVAAARYALIVTDSLRDLDEENHAMHMDDDAILDLEGDVIEDPALDWDGALIDALTTLGLEPVGMPDWLWAHVQWSYAA